MQKFMCEFEMNGARYSCIIEAESIDDAELRIAAMRQSLVLLGTYGGSIPADDPPSAAPKLFQGQQQ